MKNIFRMDKKKYLKIAEGHTRTQTEWEWESESEKVIQKGRFVTRMIMILCVHTHYIVLAN